MTHTHPSTARLTAAGCSIALAALAAAPDGAQRYLADDVDNYGNETAADVAIVAAGVDDYARCLRYLLAGVVALLADFLHDGDPGRYEHALDAMTRAATRMLDQAAAE